MRSVFELKGHETLQLHVSWDLQPWQDSKLIWASWLWLAWKLLSVGLSIGLTPGHFERRNCLTQKICQIVSDEYWQATTIEIHGLADQEFAYLLHSDHNVLAFLMAECISSILCISYRESYCSGSAFWFHTALWFGHIRFDNCFQVFTGLRISWPCTYSLRN